MKKRFDIKAGVRGGVGAVIPTGVVSLGIIVLLGARGWEMWVWTLILCAVSFILGMVWFSIKTASEKDENP
jgi:ABC-type spermidine/putrescine transport system permease subunit II